MTALRLRSIAGILLLSALVGFTWGCSKTSDPLLYPSAVPSASASAAPSPSPSPEAPTGIDPEKFTAAATSYIDRLNAEDGAFGGLTVKISVTYIIGFVDITVKDPTAWSGFTDAEKKDYITDLGKELDDLAIANIFPGTLKRVGTDTTFYAPDGRKLIERTSLGIVKLY